MVLFKTIKKKYWDYIVYRYFQGLLFGESVVNINVHKMNINICIFMILCITSNFLLNIGKLNHKSP